MVKAQPSYPNRVASIPAGQREPSTPTRVAGPGKVAVATKPAERRAQLDHIASECARTPRLAGELRPDPQRPARFWLDHDDNVWEAIGVDVHILEHVHAGIDLDRCSHQVDADGLYHLYQLCEAAWARRARLERRQAEQDAATARHSADLDSFVATWGLRPAGRWITMWATPATVNVTVAEAARILEAARGRIDVKGGRAVILVPDVTGGACHHELHRDRLGGAVAVLVDAERHLAAAAKDRRWPDAYVDHRGDLYEWTEPS